MKKWDFLIQLSLIKTRDLLLFFTREIKLNCKNIYEIDCEKWSVKKIVMISSMITKIESWIPLLIDK